MKAGTISPNAKTIQWRTQPYKGLYSEADCSYFGLVQYLTMKSGGYHLEFSKVKDRFAQILSQIPWLNIEAIQTDLKSGINFFCFQENTENKG